MAEQGILDDAVLHGRLCLSACILAELLANAPASVSTAQLVRASGHAADEVERMCSKLWHNGLLRPDTSGEKHWLLAAPPDRMTLADLFAALLHEPSFPSTPAGPIPH